MKIFFLGHKGFLGKHLLPRLQDLNFEVITDLRYWDDRYDLVINLASKTHTRTGFDPQLIESNYILADKLFRRSERIIFASSCIARYPESSPYAMSKVWAEHLGNKHGNSVGLRFFNMYGGNGTRGIVWYLTQQPSGAKITITGSHLVRDYIAVQSAIEEIIKKINSDSIGVFDVGTSIGTSTLELVQLYRKLSGKHFELEFAPASINEPLFMIADRAVLNAIDLETGLKSLIESNK